MFHHPTLPRGTTSSGERSTWVGGRSSPGAGTAAPPRAAGLPEVIGELPSACPRGDPTTLVEGRTVQGRARLERGSPEPGCSAIRTGSGWDGVAGVPARVHRLPSDIASTLNRRRPDSPTSSAARPLARAQRNLTTWHLIDRGEETNRKTTRPGRRCRFGPADGTLNEWEKRGLALNPTIGGSLGFASAGGHSMQTRTQGVDASTHPPGAAARPHFLDRPAGNRRTMHCSGVPGKAARRGARRRAARQSTSTLAAYRWDDFRRRPGYSLSYWEG